MDNKTFHDVKNFLENNPTLESVNAEILKAEQDAKAAIDKVKNFADSEGVSVNIYEVDVISLFIWHYTGIAYLKPWYQNDFKDYTARLNGFTFLFHSVREAIHNYNKYLNANFIGDTVKTGNLGLYDQDNKILIKEYQNGNAIYSASPDLVERIEIVKWIDNFFSERMYK